MSGGEALPSFCADGELGEEWEADADGEVTADDSQEYPVGRRGEATSGFRRFWAFGRGTLP